MKKIFKWGTSPDFKEYKNQAIVVSNKLTFVLLLLGLSSLIVSFFFAEDLLPYSAAYIAILIVSLAANYFKAPDISRFLHLAGSVVLISVVHSIAVDPGMPLNKGIYLIQFCLVIFPLLVFDFRETILCVITTLLALFFFSFQHYVVEIINPEVALEVFDSPLLEYSFYLAFLFIVIYALYNLSSGVAENDKMKESVYSQIMEKSKQMTNKQNELQKRIAEINETHELEEKRSWVARGISLMIDLMRSRNEDMYPVLIEEIVKHLGASVGVIYTISDEEYGDKELVMEGCYAFDRRKFWQTTVPFGDGLIGQSCIDREIIYLEDVPQGFLEFSSGLGDKPPSYLAVVPLMEEGNIAGVLEIATHKPFESHQKEFLKQLSVSIASFILTASINEKIRFLIEQNQVQAEEMKAQEEEMMQNIKELNATQEEMARKEKEYISSIEELEKKLEKKESLRKV